MKLLNSLNPAQREAALHVDGSLLILAGAGSGKTKTITTRLAYLLTHIGVAPQNTLTLTFTNKAAKEMQERAFKLIQESKMPESSQLDISKSKPQDSQLQNSRLQDSIYRDSHQQGLESMPLLCTFHKFGLLFLQRHMKILGRSNLFSIADEDDKRRILKVILKGLNVAEILKPKDMIDYISRAKNNNLAPHEIVINNKSESKNTEERALLRIYKEYEEYLLRYNLVDFDDLLLLTYRILRLDSNLCESMSKRYQYIMVDEYQDTNNLQVSLLKMLTSTHNNICAVGDDDQSIYGWRGANVKNILEFDLEFAGARIIKLEENYRSTKQILKTANNLIRNNTQRHGKILKAIKPEGSQVRFFNNTDDREEMQKIIDSIYNLVAQGSAYKDIAILFRLNSLSRNVEHYLTKQDIPFKLIGTIRFYERQEIKDCVAYLRLALNPHDDFFVERVINKPKRSIGENTLRQILDIAKNYSGIYDAYKSGALDSLKCRGKLGEFFTLIESMNDNAKTHPKEIINIFQTRIKLYTEEDSNDMNESRRENIDEFLSILEEFIDNHNSEEQDVLQHFLDEISLDSTLESAELSQDSVTCMSIHNSKGLEFPHVFVIGLEEGLFPLGDLYTLGGKNSDSTTMNEERRLAYVAFTRAKDTLTLSHAKSRFHNGKRSNFHPSVFLLECGVGGSCSKLSGIQEPNLKGVGAGFRIRDFKKQDSKSLKDTSLESNGKSSEEYFEVDFKKGECASHKIFGFGRIESVQGSGEDAKVTINFGGQKRVILASFLSRV